MPYYSLWSNIDHILGAVRQNRQIKKLTLHCLGNPPHMQDFLTGNETLTSFSLICQDDKYPLTRTTAKAIATGLQGNEEHCEVELFVHTCHIWILSLPVSECSAVATAAASARSWNRCLSGRISQRANPKLGSRVFRRQCMHAHLSNS
jgi:hypothetical protein